MKKEMNAVIGQSGGPTSVINSSLAGAITGLKNINKIKNIYGMKFGIEGFLKSNFINLSLLPEESLTKLKATPSSALGSSRYKLLEKDFPEILNILKKNNIHYFFLIGGNDSMDTINKIEQYCQKNNYELVGIGIPKTVDNDLFGTDHTPGFASAATYNMLSVKQAGILARNMQKVDKFTIYQTIGRDAGWLAGATALARDSEKDAPHLIYMPERAFVKEQFLHDVDNSISKYGWVSIVCGEGIKYSDGTPVSNTGVKDQFNNMEFGAMGGTSVAIQLHKMISKAFNIRGEFQITESLIMCAIDRASKLDLKEAYSCGLHASKLALEDISGYMVSIKRISNNPYTVKYSKVPLKDVAIKAKPMSDSYINKLGNFVSDDFKEYMNPLVENIPEYINLL